MTRLNKNAILGTKIVPFGARLTFKNESLDSFRLKFHLKNIKENTVA